MPDSRAVETFFETIQPAWDELKGAAEAARPDAKIGCALGIVVPAVSLFVALMLPVPWWVRLIALVAGVACAAIGVPRIVRFAGKAPGMRAPFEERILRPYVALLMPGAALQREGVSSRDWRRALLFASGVGGPMAATRLAGPIAGLPATLDETFWQLSDMTWQFYGWIVRFELPFAVAGHLRVRHVRNDRWVITKGFQPLAEPTARLGDEYEVDVGPLEGEPLAGIVPTALVTLDLLEWIRTDPGVQVAVAGRELWVALGSKQDVFPAQIVNLELETLRRGIERFERAEAIARCILAAGGVRT